MFYSSEFDFARVLSQILLMQAGFYLLMSTILLLFHFVLGTPLHCAVLFSSKAMSTWLGTSVHLATALLLPLLVRSVIMRAKLCLDFILTMYGFHIIATIYYDNTTIPRSLFFWGVYSCMIIYTVIVGEYLCMQVELSEIPLDFLSTDGDSHSKQTSRRKNSDTTAGHSRRRKKDDRIIDHDQPDEDTDEDTDYDESTPLK